MGSQYYRSVHVRVEGWRLPTNRPRVLLAQLRTRFRPADGANGRIRLDIDEDYMSRLYATLGQLEEHKAQFLLFPEFAWPFARLKDAIERASNALPRMAACIMPFEHLTLDEFRELVVALPVGKKLARQVQRDVEKSIAPAERARALVNVAVLLVRLADGVHAFLQQKTRPAGLEESRYLGTKLAGGRNRYVFHGDGFKVAVAVCFDLIARDDAHKEHPRETMTAPPSLLFVPECNPSPLHETYARAIVDLYEEPQWARAQELIVFANVAAGSDLPAVPDARFGFSRAVGPLGGTSPPMRDVFLTKNAIVAHADPVSLEDVDRRAQVINTKAFSWMIARPEQSLVAIDVPTLDARPAHDPVGGRTDTEVSVSRWAAGTKPRWHRIRAALDPPPERHAFGVPLEHLVELIDADQVVKAFLAALEAAARPVWVFGEGGIGKTAAVANALYGSVEKAGRARIVWLDMARLARRPEALPEALLGQLGLVRGLSLPPDEQWKVLAEHLRSATTIVVLDSFERWEGGELPPELHRLHGWPVRVVVTARYESSADVENFAIPPMSPRGRLDLLRRVPGVADIGNLDALQAALGSTPLGIVWFSGLMDASPGLAAQMGASLPAGANEEAVFDWCVQSLTDAEARVLSVLHELPAPVSRAHLTAITGELSGEIEASVTRLEQLNLVAATNDGLHTRHPFVRQFWSRVPRAALDAARSRLAGWAEAQLGAHGGDRNWSGYRELDPLWPNIRSVLDQLLAPPALPVSRRRFLGLWRSADYFLWSSGRLRERLELGRAAADVARALGDQGMLAHALFDSIAETLWHRGGQLDECLALLDEAKALYVGLANPSGEAMVECYRSRLLREHERLELAQSAGRRALALAKETQDEHALGHAANALGNVFRVNRKRERARVMYLEARKHFRKAGDLELEAIVERNLGRCALEAFDYAGALERFEDAMDEFHKLGLAVEEAQVGMYRAQALLRLGERGEAVSQLAIARRWFEAAGAVGRVRELEKILADDSGRG